MTDELDLLEDKINQAEQEALDFYQHVVFCELGRQDFAPRNWVYAGNGNWDKIQERSDSEVRCIKKPVTSPGHPAVFYTYKFLVNGLPRATGTAPTAYEAMLKCDNFKAQAEEAHAEEADTLTWEPPNKIVRALSWAEATVRFFRTQYERTLND